MAITQTLTEFTISHLPPDTVGEPRLKSQVVNTARLRSSECTSTLLPRLTRADFRHPSK